MTDTQLWPDTYGGSYPVSTTTGYTPSASSADTSPASSAGRQQDGITAHFSMGRMLAGFLDPQKVGVVGVRGQSARPGQLLPPDHRTVAACGDTGDVAEAAEGPVVGGGVEKVGHDVVVGAVDEDTPLAFV